MPKTILIASMALLAAGLSACADREQPQEIRAMVLKLNPLKKGQKASTAPTFSLAPATFHTLSDLDTLSGRYFEMIEGAEISDRAFAPDGSLAEGRTPRLRYTMKDGVAIPRDYRTLAMMSAYYQFDVVATRLKELSGISMEDLVRKHGKMKIYFEPVLLETFDDNGEKRHAPKVNAAFVPEVFSFILFQRSSFEAAPLAANLQVITHEFGHAIFQDAFLGGASTGECGSFEKEEVAGLNEGFADFFSYALTGSSDILGNSLTPILARERNFSVADFDFADLRLGDGEDPFGEAGAACLGGPYCVGTLFAKALFQAQRDRGIDLQDAGARAVYARRVVSALRETATALRSAPNALKESPGSSPACLVNAGLESLGQFFRILTSRFSEPGEAGALCSRFARNFGTEGFPTADRASCAPVGGGP